MDAYDAYKKGDMKKALSKYYFLAELGYEIAQSNVAYILDKGNYELCFINVFNEIYLLNYTELLYILYLRMFKKAGNLMINMIFLRSCLFQY